MTNSNVRGSSRDRLQRKLYLMEAYACDVPGHVRCYRCGCLLDFDAVTIDRITPGALGGTYRRNNIRPACSPCQTVTGNQLKAQLQSRPARQWGNPAGGVVPTPASAQQPADMSSRTLLAGVGTK